MAAMENGSLYLIKFEAYLLTKKRLADNTLKSYMSDLRHYTEFLQDKYKVEAQNANTKQVKAYLKSLKDLELLPRSMARKVSSLKVFYAFLEDLGFDNLAASLVFPVTEKRLPNYLSDAQVATLIEKAKEDQTDLGKQFYTALMLLYATGLRVSELVTLKVCDIQFDTGLLSVYGKGGKGRLVPVPLLVLEQLKNYLEVTFKSLHNKEALGNFPVFATKRKGSLKPHSRQWVWGQLKSLAVKAGIEKTLSPHVLRHSLATHLLKNGADLRTLQMLLGHENVKTVEIYTHLDTSHLRHLYDKKHPRAK